MSVVSIMQPAYLPWLGYFDRIVKSDIHIILDHVAMDKSSKTKFLNRNKIRTLQGWSWITVPMQSTKREDNVPINKLNISTDSNWQEKHWRTIRTTYGKTAYFNDHKEFFRNFYLHDWKSMLPMLEDSTNYLKQSLGISTKCIYSSALSPKMKKAELILELCKEVGATEYISGPFGKDYINQHVFDMEGIKLSFQEYNHPVYSQSINGFEPFLSTIDLLFNQGPNSLSILKSKKDDAKKLVE